MMSSLGVSPDVRSVAAPRSLGCGQILPMPEPSAEISALASVGSLARTPASPQGPRLALSLRHWDIGQHGVWGGLVAAERAALRRRRHPSIIRESTRVLLTDGVDPDVAVRSSPGGGS